MTLDLEMIRSAEGSEGIGRVGEVPEESKQQQQRRHHSLEKKTNK